MSASLGHSHAELQHQRHGPQDSPVVEWVTSIHALEPGDILATGTNHRGLSGFQDGDRIELETEGLGRLRFGNT
jgi:2-keto-4-pentenoate hydratase/2-oxohepta-3-ene-1,7-dioic acid hydratase in catechol pathway